MGEGEEVPVGRILNSDAATNNTATLFAALNASDTNTNTNKTHTHTHTPKPRSKLLRALLEREQLFATATGSSLLESEARANAAHELQLASVGLVLSPGACSLFCFAVFCRLLFVGTWGLII
jgi:hypothetical protein